MFEVLSAASSRVPPELLLGVVAADRLPLPVAPIVDHWHDRLMLRAAWATLVQWHAHCAQAAQAQP